MTDSSAIDDSGYSVDKFYTGSRDKKGFRVERRVSLPPNLSGELAALVASREIPQYRTVEDFLRDAINHRLMYVAGKRGSEEFSAFVDRFIEVDKLHQVMEYEATNERYLDELTETLSRTRNQDSRNTLIESAKRQMAKSDEYNADQIQKIILRFQ